MAEEKSLSLWKARWTSDQTTPNNKDLEPIRELIEDVKLRPTIEKTYPLDQIVETHRHIENRHTKGKVAIEIRKGVILHPVYKNRTITMRWILTRRILAC